MSSALPFSSPQLLQGGQAYFPALIAALDAATSWVQLETYIFDFYGAGSQVADALVRAAARGVKVQVMVDGVGSSALSPEWQKKFADAGVQWCVYSPLAAGWMGLFGLLIPNRWRRLHRKLCVVDQRLVFCGGINVLDDFYDPHYGVLSTPRLDFVVVLQGPVAQQANDAMALLWWRVQAGYSARQRHLSQAWKEFKKAGYGGADTNASSHPAQPGGATSPWRAWARQRLTHKSQGPGPGQAALVLRNNLRNRSSIERAYRKAIAQAKTEVLIANAYFLPGGRLRRALIKASERGVKVVLLLQGRYEYFMQHHAAQPVYGALLQAGVEIYEYDRGFLHAKVAVIDGYWATVGSSNLDPLSLLLAHEANVVIKNQAFAKTLQTCLRHAMDEHGRRLDATRYNQRPWRQRLLDRVAYAIMRLALFLAGHKY